MKGAVSIITAVGLVSVMQLGATPRSDAAVDLRVSSIEVTQAIQTIPPTLTLVAQRSTAIRATIGVSGTGSAVPGVTGRLHVFVNNVEITPVAGTLPINAPMTAPLAPNRNNENETLNFELIAPTGIGASTNVDVRVDVSPVPGEVNTSNNSGTLDNLTFVNRCAPDLFFTRINFIPAGVGLPDLSEVQPGVGDAFVRGIYPLREDVPFYQQGLFPTLDWNYDPNTNGVLDALSEGSELLDFLESCRQLIVNMGIGASSSKFLYGWINDNPINGNGLASVGGFVAFGNTQHSRHQRSYAHELTHNFGLNHNNRTLVQTGWDVGARLVNNPSDNNVSGRVKQSSYNDVMVAGLMSNVAWVDPVTYAFLLSSPILDCANDTPDSTVAVIRGVFSSNGQQLLRLSPVFRFPWLSEPTPTWLLRGRFAARVRDNQGQTQVLRFDARIADDAGGNSAGVFSVMARVLRGRQLASVLITDSTGVQVYDSLKVSSPPQVQILSPSSGDSLGDFTTVQWSSQDTDTPAAKRMFQIAYSRNNGASWVPVAVNVPGTRTSITFDSRQIERAIGTGRIRVFISDGLNTRDAQITGLTTKNAMYRVDVGQGISTMLAMRALPNPFTSETSIVFALTKPTPALVRVYDVTGRLIRTLHAGALDAGLHVFWWDGMNSGGARVAAGVYVVQARVGKVTSAIRIVRLK